MSQQAYKFTATINPQGRIEVTLPLAPGTPVEVLVLTPAEDDLSDLVAAAASSLDFWNHPLDDEWNNV